jgi:hypothetical protein
MAPAPDGAAPDPQSPALEDSMSQLRDLLLQPEMTGLAETRRLVENVQRDIHDPERITQILLPVIDKVLSRKVAESREMVAKAIAPIIDSAMRERMEQDEGSLTTTLAPVIGDLIRAFAEEHPLELAEALHPVVMPSAARHLRYRMRECVFRWDDRLRRLFLLRRRSADGAGGAAAGSAADRAYLPDCVFLLHRGTGTLIAQAERRKAARLAEHETSELLAKVHAQVEEAEREGGEPAKVALIPFGESTVAVEMGELCYAALLMGYDAPTPSYLFQVQQALTNIEHHNRKALEEFEPGSTTLSGNVTRILQNLLGQTSTVPSSQRSSRPTAVITLTVLIALALLGGAGWYGYLVGRALVRGGTIRRAFLDEPALAEHGVAVRVHGHHVELTGSVPSSGLRVKAEEVARAVAPGVACRNLIRIGSGLAPSVGPGRQGAADAVAWTTDLLNLVAGVDLETSAAEDGGLTVRGRVAGQRGEDPCCLCGFGGYRQCARRVDRRTRAVTGCRRHGGRGGEAGLDPEPVRGHQP